MYRTLLLTTLALALLAGSTPQALAQGTITNNPYTNFGSNTGGYPYYPSYNIPELYGAAEVIRAQGQIMTSQQQAFLEREKVRAARIDNRRKELEQFLWEREHMPTPEDDRQRFQEEQARRARFGSDLTEIWSAKALNTLLADARKITSTSDAAGTALGEDVLAKINVTSGKGNVGIIKSGRITWPLLLKRPAFDKERERLNYLADRAVQQGGAGQIKPETVEEMSQIVDQLQQKLRGLARDAGDNATWTQTMYIEASNFLNQFDDVVRGLQQPDAANFLSNKYRLKGNIADIVKFMTDNGLQFAPATEGSQSAYNALYEALRSYDEQAGSKTRDRR
jgi:hypothetical protein